jgi:hypothetical protein
MYKISAFVLLLLSGCTLSSPTIPNFDADKWKNDTNGCSNERFNQLEQIYEYKDLLLGFNQNEIKYYLGKPDEQELFNRSQTFFHYYISNHKSCDQSSVSKDPISLQIRFNALNSSNEVFFQNYKMPD